jgi:hypothetical protein
MQKAGRECNYYLQVWHEELVCGALTLRAESVVVDLDDAAEPLRRL